MAFYNKLIEYVNNMNIRTKLISTYSIVVLTSVLFVGIILTIGMRDLVVKQAITEAGTNTDRLQNSLNGILKKVTNVADKIYFDKELQSMVLKKYVNTWDVVNDYYEYTEFTDMLRTFEEISNIKLYVENETMLDNGQFIQVTPSIIQSSWYKEAISNSGAISWQYVYNEEDGEYCLCLTRLIKKADSRNNIGVLVIFINNDFLVSMLKEEPFETVFALSSKHIILSGGSNAQERKVDLKDITFLSNYIHNDVRRVNDKNNPMMIITNAFSPVETNTVFNIFTIVPIATIIKPANKIILLGLQIIGSSLIISLALLLLFSKLFSSRIMKLRNEMHKAVEGDLEISNAISGKDEIGELYKDFTSMIGSLKLLIREVYEEKLLKEQLRNKQKEIEFKMLAKIMRRYLNASNKMVTLKSEIELIQNYLELQKCRFTNKINYDIEIYADIQNYYVLPLIVQPIIENAFVHGLEVSVKKGMIKIAINVESNFLIISVMDNGVGIDEDKLNYIREKLNICANELDGSIGLCNVNNRIKLFYGEDYGIRIDSSVNEGTQVVISLPESGALYAENTYNR